MNCPNCGNSVEKDAPYCLKCFARIEPPSFWKKLVKLFRGSAQPRRSVINLTKTISVKTTDPDGQHNEYHSLKEAPPEVRAELEKLQAEGMKEVLNEASSDGRPKEFITKKTISVFKVKDASGVERTYHSLDELPANLRAALEQAQKQTKK